jgi:uncharacterized protein YndB with AHSA1/START domain
MAIEQIPSPSNVVIITADFPTCSPEELFSYFTKPDLLRQWWVPESEIDARPNGTYNMIWPKQNWHLRGHYSVFQPGKALAFTWQWDHHPIERMVEISFNPLASPGTHLTITHNSYTESVEDSEERKGHIEGWLYLITRLQEIVEPQEHSS